MLNDSITPPAFGDPRMPDRFWLNIRVGVFGCWVWQGLRDPKGYARDYRMGTSSSRMARAAYSALVEVVPSGLVVDHLCRNRTCVRPGHLEVVTDRVNTMRGDNPAAINARKMYCKWGHPLFGDNMRIRPDRARECRACRLRREPISNAVRKAKRREKRLHG